MEKGDRVYAVLCPPYKESLFRIEDRKYVLIANSALTHAGKLIFFRRGYKAVGKQRIELTLEEAYGLARQLVPAKRLEYYFGRSD